MEKSKEQGWWISYRYLDFNTNTAYRVIYRLNCDTGYK
jgi:hypothetical protein